MASPTRNSMHKVNAWLSAEEYAALLEVKAALSLTNRDLLLLAIRRAKTILAIERRKQRGNGQ